jgi:Flp pilus assembly protein TadG
MSKRQAKEPAMFPYKLIDAKSFSQDQKGSVAMLFGLSAIAVCMFAGLAFDVGRAYSAKSKSMAAADAAALSAVKAMRLEGLNETQAGQLAQSVFMENMNLQGINFTEVRDFTVTIDAANNRAVVNANTVVATSFAGLAGIREFVMPTTASAVFESKDIEVAVQLDLTGSMCSPCSKRDALRTATADLVQILIPAQPTNQKVRVAFAPFSAGVNVGPYLKAVDGNRNSSNNCVYERISSTNAATDNLPVGNDAYKIRSDLTGFVQSCPGTSIVPLTDDRDRLVQIAGSLDATGSTAGQLGASWAYNLVSEKWAGIWGTDSAPAAHDGKTDKVVILMTDGVYNTIGGVNFGDTSAQAAQASAASVDLCTKMKNVSGITVYTVGFDLDGISNTNARNRARSTLQSCAGKAGVIGYTGYFHEADNEQALRDAFRAIANDIARLRLAS